MNFFEHQDRARRRSWRLVLLFALAVLLIVVAIDAVALAALGTRPGAGESWLGTETLESNTSLILGAAIATVGAILLASLLRTMTLRGGGGVVARQLGGTPVESDAADPLRRRLHNVVEEMAIASGVPVPEVYVLEREPGINAFAAGYSTADAAVAVTQGALEQLNRDELQGVVAHEFSHILNGDMRLNIRLMGLLFGILALALVGRVAIRATRHGRDARGAAGIAAIGLALMLVGYIGLFFGRWIKASVSRQREYLADASAVQFTRNPSGLAGALKRIGASQAGSRLEAESDEVGHMLFAGGAIERMFATHPPLERRIRAIDPSFRPEEIEEIAAQMQRHAAARRAEVEAGAGSAGRRPERRGAGPLDPEGMIERIGVPGIEQVLAASAVVAAIPDPMTQAAHSIEWAPEVLFYLLVDPDPQVRARQLEMVAEARGAESERRVRALLTEASELPPEQRLPLLEIAFPALRRRPRAELRELLELIDHLVAADRRVDPFEYALARLTAVQVEDALHPERTRPAGRKRLPELRDEVADLVAIVARHGNADEAAARAAYEVGIARVLVDPPPIPPATDEWPAQLDRALASLDRLRGTDTQRLVGGLASAVLHDAEAIPAELELLRTICASIHVPLPVLDVGEGPTA